MKRPITLAGFEATFAGNPDPWNTFAAADERRKRDAIVHALGAERLGRVIELASGNGSNTLSLARRALRLDATDGAPRAVDLTRKLVAGLPRVEVRRLALPARFPHVRYDAIVAAEILYYLSPRDLAAVAVEVGRRLRTGGRLVLAHSHIRFADAAQSPADVHDRFVAGLPVRRVHRVRTERWRVEAYVRS